MKAENLHLLNQGREETHPSGPWHGGAPRNTEMLLLQQKKPLTTPQQLDLQALLILQLASSTLCRGIHPFAVPETAASCVPLGQAAAGD